MKKYIGTKTIQAEPMTLGEFIQKTGRNPYVNSETFHKETEEGYKVVYEDGYESWSPKEVFEKVYKPAETYIERMMIEAEELTDKLCKLGEFIRSDKSRVLTAEKYNILEAQHSVMNGYLAILLARIRMDVEPILEQETEDKK